MSSLPPVLNLGLHSSTLFCSSAFEILSFDSVTGEALASTSACPTEDQHTGVVRLLAVSPDGGWLASVADDKLLKVWAVSEDRRALRLSSSREPIKKISTVSFLRDNSLVIGDRSGDAFTYPLHPRPRTEQAEAAASHTKTDVNADPALNPDGTLILGHTSPITALFLTADEKHIVTADRDEHIRISRYPDGFIAERFILGSQRFIGSLLLLSDQSTMLSAGGDASIHVWSFPDGDLRCRVPVLDVVRPYIKVTAPPRLSRRGKNDSQTEQCIEKLPSSEGLAILSLKEVAGCAVFSSLGATAIFSIHMADISSASPVSAYDLSLPVLDFLAFEDGRILVSVDSGTSDGSRLRGLQIVDGKLIELAAGAWPLLDALTSRLAQHTSGLTPKGGWGLYTALVELPKWSGEDEGVELEQDEDQLTKKELGRRARNGGTSSKRLQVKKPRRQAQSVSKVAAEEEEELSANA